MAYSKHIPMVAGEHSLTQYLHAISKFPLLEPRQEFDLACRWRDHQDTEAAHTLVTSHLRLVAKVAVSYRGYGLPLSDLISEGNLGMMQAVKKFDPHKGFRLATYALWWIKASIQEYVLRSWSLVKIGTTTAQKKLFFNLRRLKNQMQAIDEGQLTPEHINEIAKELNVSVEEVTSMEQRLAGADHSLNALVNSQNEGEWQDLLVDQTDNQEISLIKEDELSHRQTLLQKALTFLNSRERQILTDRRLLENPRTLEELSMQHGVSRERIRQIEVRAFEKLQQSVGNLISEQKLSF